MGEEILGDHDKEALSEFRDKGALEGSEENWTTEEVEDFIEEIKSNPIIYNMSTKDHKNVGKKELIWMKVSQRLGKSGEVCKKKWKYLRDTYSRKKKQIKGKSGKKGRKVNKWEYFELLKFLEPFVSCNPESSGNIPQSFQDGDRTNAPAPDAEDKNEYQSKGEHDGGNSSKDKYVGYSNPPSSKKARLSDKVDDALLGYLSARTTEVKDVNHHFCMALAEQMRGFSPALAAYARSKIQHVMYEIEFPAPPPQ